MCAAFKKKFITTIRNIKNKHADLPDHKRIDTKEFFKISFWTLQFVYKLDKKRVVAHVIFDAVRTSFSIVNAYVFAKLLDAVIAMANGNPGKLSNVYQVLSISLAVLLLQTIINFFDNYISSTLRTITRPKITQSFYSKLYDLGIQTLEQPEINNKIQRAQENLQSIFQYVDWLIYLISDFITLIGTAATLLFVSPILILIMVIIHIPYFLFDKKYRSLIWGLSYETTEEARKAMWSTTELNSSTGLQEISVTSSFNFLDRKYMDFQDWYVSKWISLTKRWRVGNSSFGFLTDFALLFGYLNVFNSLISKSVTVGVATFQIRMLQMLQTNISAVFREYNDLAEYALRIKDTYALYQFEPFFPDGDIEFPKLNKGPEIEVENISFKYPNSQKYIFNNLSLKIKPGEKVALVGHNGAGKTTLVKLLCRIYQPTEGQININNQNLSNLKIADWYKNIGVLFQEFNQYPQLSVKENIYIGNPLEPLNESNLRLAAQSADALDFIEEYPNKFDQILSEKFKDGIRPSTGQWQKIAIARFFYRNAPMVIFDEPTAAIDAVSEYNIFNRIYDFFQDKTVLIISHRFSTVRNADRIIVLDHGEIIEEGNHNTLVSKGGYYAKAFNLQAKGYTSTT